MFPSFFLSDLKICFLGYWEVQMYRVEDKFAYSEKDMFLLQARLQTVMDRDGNQKREEGYKITSVYFDDFNDSCYYDAVNGVRDRCKYRIRIYDDSFDIIKLEIKYKHDSRIYKISQKITFEEMTKLLRKEVIDDYEIKDDVMTRMQLAMKTKDLRPVVIVEYDRTAFVYDPGNVRITLDRNLRYSTDIEDFINRKKDYCRMIPDTGHVVEVKYDEFLPGFIAGVLEGGNMEQSSFSKYCLCRRMELNYDNERCY